MPHYVLHDEYIPDQQQLKSWIEDEFHQTEHSIDTVRVDLKSFEHRVDRRFDGVDARFDVIDARLDNHEQRLVNIECMLLETRADVQRSTAQNQNSRIRNPHQPIQQVIVLDPVKGIVRPDATLYPKNAAEFYSLRNPTTERKHRMLEYLITFYDVTHVHVPEEEIDDNATSHPQLAVDYLETILGLDENNIEQFRQRARMFDRDQTFLQPFKRTLATEEERPVQRQKLEIRPFSADQPQLQEKAKSPSDNLSSQSAKLGWDTRSTPSSKKAINRGVATYLENERLAKEKNRKDQAKQRRRDQGEEVESSSPLQESKSPSDEQEKTAESGTTTNPNTPRADST
jgi:hypothetical protein